MSSPHPQVVAVLERAARSGLPLYYEVSPFVARRIYRDTRGALAPKPPAVAEARLLLAPGPAGPIPLRAFRPQGTTADEVLPALVYFHGGGWVIGDLDTHDVVCRQFANGARCAVFSVDYRLAPEYRFPARSRTASQQRNGLRRRRRRSRSTRHASRWAATARAATWRPWSRSRRASPEVRRFAISC